MGAPMAANLIKAGHELHVHDVSPDAVAALVHQGAEAAGSAAALGRHCEVVFTSLPTPAIVREATLGPDSIFVRGKPRVFCDLSTSGPRLAQEIARDLDDDQALEAVAKVVDFYKQNAKRGERVGKMMERLGIEALKEIL